MRIFFASLDYKVIREYKKRFPEHEINAMLTFARPTHDSAFFDANRNNVIDCLYCDSGTFTMIYSQNKSGYEISLKAYKAYLKQCCSCFDRYFNFDEIHKPRGREQNYENYLFLQEAGFDPVPVIQDVLGDEIDYYNKEHGSTFMALGSRFNYTSDKAKPLFEKIVRMGISVHLFGHTKYEWLIDMPVASVDSSTCHRDSVDGKLKYWNESLTGEDKTVIFDLCDNFARELKSSNPITRSPYLNEFENFLLNTFEFTLQDMYGENRYLYRQIVNLYYYHTLQERITAIHKQKGFST